jgi:ribose 5-phosphate isomerase RpiB
MAANRVPEVRAVNAFNVYIAEQSRLHGASNVLCLGAVTFEHKLRLVFEIVNVWLKTQPLTDPRYVARINKIDTFWAARYAKLPGSGS